tara:strand:- start:1113 stop:1346 length:234 start_codon:yes stop_codon:yes gene_type:complete
MKEIKIMSKTKTFEAFRHDLKKGTPDWVVIPQDKGESYAKYKAAGNPIRIAWLNTETKETKYHNLNINAENLPAATV